MQALYAVQKSEEANFELAKDYIEEVFSPDLNSMEVQDKALLKQNAKQAKKVFQENFKEGQVQETENSSPEIKKVVSDSINDFHNNSKKDINFIKKDMLEAVHKLSENYLLSLKLLVEFALLSKEDVVKKEKRVSESGKKVFESELNLFHNKAIQILNTNDALNNEFSRMAITWEHDILDVREWHRDILKKSDFYKDYLQLAKPTFAEDVEVIDRICRQVILKSDAITSFMAERDLYWEENKSALKSMLKKSVKSLNEQTQHIELIELSANWEDDFQFFKDLFAYSVNNDEAYEQIVSNFAKNWATERIASVDMIILKMAVSEMLNFPSIPIKVTINEYIELSKNYSTPKSKLFVNGMLDKISASLEKDGKIRKSGRGLIDNK